METTESQLSSVYIVPLVQFMVGVCLFLSLLYGQRELTILAVLILGITIGTNLWSRLILSGIRCSSMVDKHRLFPGESLDLNLNAENNLFLPVWLQVNMRIEGALAPSSTEINFTSNCGLLWYQQTRFSYRLVARRRGVYRVGSAHVKVGDIFGFFPRKKRTAGDTDVIVYPRLVPLKPLALENRDFLGLPGATIPIQDPIYILGTRDYQHGRPSRHIYWKASARHNRLQEKVFEPSEQKKILLAIEVNQFEKANASERFERTLEIAGSLAVQSYQRGYALGFVTNGVVAGGSPWVSTGRSPQQIPAILEILARLKMRTAECFADTLRRIPELPWGLSSVHFVYKHDEDTQSTAQYFSNRRIPLIFVNCSSRLQWKGNEHAPAVKAYCLDEICIQEDPKP
jgi:uncharacterized protein (DUF58 family)